MEPQKDDTIRAYARERRAVELQVMRQLQREFPEMSVTEAYHEATRILSEWGQP